MNRRIHLVLLVACLVLLPNLSWAQRVDQLQAQTGLGMGAINDRIAAVVNDNVITTSDINERMKLAILSSGLPPSPEIEQRLFPQILRGLIDEQLQLQEAKRLDITISKADIDRTIEHIAHDNHIDGDMREYLKAHGGSPVALEQQIRAGISWSKVVQRELRPRVDVGDDEIETVIERLRNNAGKEEFNVSEILLTVDNPKDDEEVRQVADNLVQQLKGGANFGAVARQFSQSTGAASGGDIGWIQEGQLPTELNHALLDMQPNDVVGPIHTAGGYHILLLKEKRTISVGNTDPKDIILDLQQAFRPFDPGTNHDALVQETTQLRETMTGCEGLKERLAQRYPLWHWQKLGNVTVDKIPGWITDLTRETPVGKGSEPLSTDKGVLVVFVCARHVPEGNVDREAIMNTIGTEKLELQARRLMRDLHRSAYLDIRLGNGS